MPKQYFLYCMHFSVAPCGGRAGLQLFILAPQTKNQKRITSTFFSCFDNLQYYNDYLTQHHLLPAHLPISGTSARQNQNKCHVCVLVSRRTKCKKTASHSHLHGSLVFLRVKLVALFNQMIRPCFPPLHL